MSQYKLVPKLTISDNTSEVFCVRFSPDGKFLAAGCGDGGIRVFNTQSGVLAYNLQGGSNASLPTTSIRFRPITASTRTKNVFLAANATGVIQHWHMTSGKCLHTSEDPGNEVYALDYNDDGSKFATAGKDTCIRVYEEATKTLLCKMQGGAGYGPHAAPGHSNRIFSIKYMPGNENIIVSGGWDNTVQIWDLREGSAVRSIFGPHICGDSLDVVGNEVLTGSWRQNNQLEIWDFGTGKKIADVPWVGGVNNSVFASVGQPACMLYAAQFSKEGSAKFIAAGGSGQNEAKIFDHINHNEVVGTVTGLHRGIFAIDFSPDVSNVNSQTVAIAGGDSSIRILEIIPQ